ncbi:MAG: M14 family zinc carboxypeptidase [Planctomycetaceae bacterium]
MEPQTRAEATRYAETSRHDDVVAFLDTLAQRTPLARRLSLGRSCEGRDLAAVVLASGGAFTPASARRLGRLIVVIQANIHAGEVEGKEASLALARDLTLGGRGRGILARATVVIIPDFNPDGNDRIHPENRKLDLANLEGQINPPGGVGTRCTGAGWNLNRDFTKQEAVETRSLATFLQEWGPDLFIDCHTTDGSLHGFDLTFDTARNNAPLFPDAQTAARRMLERVGATILRKHGSRSQWYGNYLRAAEPASGWVTYPPLPRFGSHYRGLLGMVDLLLETYSYIPFRRRCEVIHAWLLELLRYAARHAPALRTAVRREQARILERGARPDPRVRVGIDHGVARRDAEGALRFDYPAHALDGDAAIIVAPSAAILAARTLPLGRLRRLRVPHHRAFLPTSSVTTPAAYLVPAFLAPRLRGHGIPHTPAARFSLEVEGYRIASIDRTSSPDVAAIVPQPGAPERPLSTKPPPVRFETVVGVRAERLEVILPAGTLVVPTAHRTGTLAVYLLEPQSDDGLCRWQFLDEHLTVGGLYPIFRALAPVT